MNQRTEIFDIRELIFILKKHFKILIIFAFLLSCAGFAFSSWIIPSQYESTALLIVNATEESSSAAITYDQISAAQQLVNTYAIIFTSDTVLDRVIENLNLDMKSQTLAGMIAIKGLNNTEVIALSVRSTDPKLAADIANEIVDVAPTVIIDAIKASSVEIISNAKINPSRVFPSQLIFTAAFALAGIIISAVVAILAEMLNNTFISGDDVQNFLGCTVIGIIPMSKKQAVTVQSIMTSSDFMVQETI